jgi:hypothetical protein
LIRTPVVRNVAELPAAVLDPVRLVAVLDAGLLDTEPEEVFDDLVRLAQVITGGQQAFFAVVDARRCYWKSVIGADTSSARQDDVHDSPCAILVASDAPLIVEDAPSGTSGLAS